MTVEAVILMALVFGAVHLERKLLPASVQPDSRLAVALVMVTGIAGTFLLRESVWANEQVLGGQQLDQLSGWDTLLAGIFVGFGATAIDQVQRAVRNIGENQPKTEIPSDTRRELPINSPDLPPQL